MSGAHAAQQTLGGQVRRGLGWSGLTQLTLRAGSFVVGIVLARLLVPEQFGVYAVALTVQSVLVMLADLGLSADLVRSEDPQRRAPTVGALGLASGSLLAVMMALTAEPVSGLLGSPDAAPVIALLSVTLVLAGAGVVPYALLQRRFAQRTLFAIAAADFVVSTAVTLALVASGWGVMGLAVGRVLAQSVTTGLQFLLSGTRPRYRIDRSVAGSVLAFGLPVAAANMLSWVVINVDNVVIARVGGPTALGLYVLAFNISTWPMSAIGQVVRSVALPGFSRSSTETRSEDLVRAASLTWALALPVGAALATLAGPVVHVVYGETWAPSAAVLVSLGLFGALRVLFDLLVSFLLADGRSGRVMLIQVVWFVALVPAVIVGTRLSGVAGAGWAHLVVSVAVVLPAYLLVLARARVDLSALVRGLVWPTVAVLPAMGVGALAVQTLGSPLLQLAIGGAGGLAVYVALVLGWCRARLRPVPVPAATPEHDLPTVSVVIPCHNYARFLPQAVSSALSQEGVQVQVVVVDDASSDDSLAVARAMAAVDGRVEVLAHQRNQGPVVAFNDGFARASGEFLVRLDADDLLTPGSLARSVAACRRFPGVGLVYGHPLHFEEEPPVARAPRPTWRVWPGAVWLEEMCRSGVNVITSPEAFVRMDVARRVGGLRDLAHTHDMEWWMRLATVCDVAYIEGVDQAWHRDHPASLSVQADSDLGILILQERLAAFDVALAGGAPLLASDGRPLADVSRESLALEAVRRACYEYDRGRAPARSVESLLEFATRCWPAVVEHESWSALESRTRAGHRWRRRRPWLHAKPLARAARDRTRYRRWSRSGLYREVTGATVHVPPTGPHRPRPSQSTTTPQRQLEGSAS